MFPYPLNSASGQRMLAYLPAFYETSRTIQAVLQTEGVELDQLREALDAVLAQYFVRSATWGLDEWERELGLTPAPNQPDNERRDRIVSHIRGVGTATIRVVKEVAASYELGGIEIAEKLDIYTVQIRFIDTLGAPPNLNDLKDAVRAVLPSHLDVEYAFKYFLIEQLDQTMTIDELQTRKLTDFAPFIPI